MFPRYVERTNLEPADILCTASTVLYCSTQLSFKNIFFMNVLDSDMTTNGTGIVIGWILSDASMENEGFLLF